MTRNTLPELLKRKLYKSGQTRGADDDEIFQNRVGRNSTVLIPFQFWNNPLIKNMALSNQFESGYIVLIKPEQYFLANDQCLSLEPHNLALGQNALIFYETREKWFAHLPQNYGWNPASQRHSPLGGNYIARIPATTATTNGGKMNYGFTETRQKGAGIRLYEYASQDTITMCRLQLEAIYWLCHDSINSATAFGMSQNDAISRRQTILQQSHNAGLLDYTRLREQRIINSDNHTICPLCLTQLSSFGFYNRMTQAEGREVPDLTITELNLFHIHELRYGEFNHVPYNLGWGHHHCNVVVKDSGIMPTLYWMRDIITRNEQAGFITNTP